MGAKLSYNRGLLPTFATVNHEVYMRRCLELAQRGQSEAAPNPMVGAILVYNDRIIGEGWHEHCGEAHAEVNCFDNVSEADRSLIPLSTMYVSLEPCAHFGRTPPCAHRVVREGVKQVVICNVDPFEKVSGSGIHILEEGGVAVTTGILEAEGRWLNRRFFCTHQLQRPYVILKWAESAEGNIAPADGSRKQLSNHFSSVLVHRWRTQEAAIMVGYNTALNDNPQLTSRHWDGLQPLRIVLDRKNVLPSGLNLLDQSAPTWIVNEEVEKKERSLEFRKIYFGDDLLPQLLVQLKSANRLSLFVEGGAQLLHSFISQGLWDEARIFKTKTSITGGLAAPHLNNGILAAEYEVAGDRLEVWTKTGTTFPFAGDSSW